MTTSDVLMPGACAGPLGSGGELIRFIARQYLYLSLSARIGCIDISSESGHTSEVTHQNAGKQETVS